MSRSKAKRKPEGGRLQTIGIFVTLVIGLFSRWGGPASAAASLLAGVGSWVLGAYVLGLTYPYLVSLAAALAAYAVVALVESARARASAVSPAGA